MRIDTALPLVILGVVTACADGARLPSAPTPREISRPLAALTFQFPAEDPGPPYYTLIERTFLPHTDEWVPIIFVRNPTCVPAGFDLLEQIAIPQAFGCGPRVEGHVTYKNAPPPVDPAPLHVLMHGTGAVPVWFVSWSALQAAIADGNLTIVELAAMPSLVRGTASSFQMTQHPGAVRPQGEGNGKIEFVARGSLEDGRSFSVQMREMGVDQVSVLRHISIEFR